MAVAWHIYSQWPVSGQHGLAAHAIAVIAGFAGLPSGRITQVMVEFGSQRTLDERLLEGHRGRFDRFGAHRAANHLVDEFLGNAGQRPCYLLLACLAWHICSLASCNNMICLTHKIHDRLAAPVCAPPAPIWLERQKTLFKTGRPTDVPKALSPYRKSRENTPTPVADAYRYIHNRPGQLDYLSAIWANLPIGSGQAESTHRSLIQKRLKLPETAWGIDNAQAMPQPPLPSRQPTTERLLGFPPLLIAPSCKGRAIAL
jgi:hypothetical protein